jgi:NIPSNAP protein
MPYDVTTITVQPNTHGKALGPIEQWLKANPRQGEFLGCFACEIGEVNTILLLHHYASESDVIADREQVAKSANPFGCAALITGMSADTFVMFPFLPAIKPGQYGPIFEIRTYRFKPNGLAPTIAAWEKAVPGRQKLSPILAAMYSVTGQVTRFMHIWPYPSLEVRAATRKTAIDTGVWPPQGGPDHLLTMRTDIYLPAPFSPIR